MTTTVFFLVLGAATLHAVWNALVKVSSDRLAITAIMVMSQAAVAFVAVQFLPYPEPESWRYIAVSAVLSTAYGLFLIKAYEYGDLSHVYPISRGSAPLIVAVVSVVIIGEALSRQAGVSIAVITIGIMSLTFTRGTEGLREPRAIFFALGTGLFIASYTVVDGLGARVAGNPHSYAFWLHLLNGIPITLIAIYFRRKSVLEAARLSWKPGVISGVVSLVAYWIVIWAMTQAPIAMVSAVRETGMIFAVLIGVFVLKERLDLVRLASIVTTFVGALFLKLSR